MLLEEQQRETGMKNKQMTLAGAGFERLSKTTRRAEFLA
jgi:hypothetical protein